VERLISLAYPTAGPFIRDVLGRDAFIDALNDSKLEFKVHAKEPTDLYSALTLTMKLEVLSKARKVQRETLKPKFSGVTQISEPQPNGPIQSNQGDQQAKLRFRQKNTRTNLRYDQPTNRVAMTLNPCRPSKRLSKRRRSRNCEITSSRSLKSCSTRKPWYSHAIQAYASQLSTNHPAVTSHVSGTTNEYSAAGAAKRVRSYSSPSTRLLFVWSKRTHSSSSSSSSAFVVTVRTPLPVDSTTR